MVSFFCVLNYILDNVSIEGENGLKSAIQIKKRIRGVKKIQDNLLLLLIPFQCWAFPFIAYGISLCKYLLNATSL